MARRSTTPSRAARERPGRPTGPEIMRRAFDFFTDVKHAEPGDDGQQRRRAQPQNLHTAGRQSPHHERGNATQPGTGGGSLFYMRGDFGKRGVKRAGETSPDAQKSRQRPPRAEDGQTDTAPTQGRQGRPAAPRGDDQRRERVTMARISSHAEHRRRWQRAGSARAVSTDQQHAQGRRSAPRGSADRQRAGSVTPGRWIGAGARGDNQHKRR